MEALYLEEAELFIDNMPDKARKKLLYNISLVLGGVKDPKLLKKLDNSEIWEFRAEYQGTAYRLFSFWDTRSNALIVSTHGLNKKTQKTPKKEIEHAEKIRKEYFNTHHHDEI
ncbi:MAG: type II toxin-antitoxin system RelE/ParE family toxin [Paludibacteraceae bacterium]|nr:type II toxin-antitoxin system RelE/ParE family toxin [Paludibacteraceae bacterium]